MPTSSPHVIDISNPEWEAQAHVVDGLISQLGASETPCLRVFNKCDAYIGILPHGDDIVCISARSGEGADALVSKSLEPLDRGKKQVKLEIPYSDAGIVDLLKREAAVLSMEYTDTGITAEAIVTPDVLGRMKNISPATSSRRRIGNERFRDRTSRDASVARGRRGKFI